MNSTRSQGPNSITLTTPWYPTPSRPMGGSFVATQARLLSRIATDVSVIHGEEWAGGPPDVVDRIRPDLEHLVELAQRRGGLARTGTVGPLIRVPVLLSGGMDVVERAEALVHDVSHAVGGRIESDIVHGHVGYLGGLVAARLASPGSRVFATEHSTGLRQLLADPRGRDIYAEVIDRSDRLLCVSNVLRQHVLDAIPESADKVEVLGNPVDVDAVPRRTGPLESLRHWIFSGGLIERKGVMRALEAFIVVAGRDPAATFTLLGEGPLRAAIERRVCEAGLVDRVRLIGMLSHTEALGLLREHDLLVAPSTYETFHLVIPEAIAAGIPVIATRSGGPQEVLDGIEDRVGRLVDVSQDPEEIVGAYEDITARLGSLDLDAGRDSLRDRFGPATIVRRLADLYGGEVSSHQRTPVRLPRPAPPAAIVVAITERRVSAVRAEMQTATQAGHQVILVSQQDVLRGQPGVLDVTTHDVARQAHTIERGKAARAARKEQLALGAATTVAKRPSRRRPRQLVRAARSTVVRILTNPLRGKAHGSYRKARRLRAFAKAWRARPAGEQSLEAQLAAALRTPDACVVLGDALSAPFVRRILDAFPQLSVCIELDRDGTTSASPDSGATQNEAVGPHVVMLVANDIRRDTRVRKSALAVAAAGARVTVVGYGKEGRREETTLGPVTLLRVPVEFARRDMERERRLKRRMRFLPGILTLDRDDTVVRRKLATRDRQAVLLPTSRREREQRSIVRRRLGLRARAYAGRRAERFVRRGWAGWDKTFGRMAMAARWQHVLPEVDDYEMAFGPVVDELRPQVIHAHDMHLVGVAAVAAARASERGDRVPWVYDAHEWVPGLSRYGGRTRRLISAWADLEASYIRFADRVVTVSAPLASALQDRYSLPRTPDVVRNIPPVGAGDLDGETVRERVGLGPDVPLLVYSGGVQAARGVDTAVDALALLPDAHLVVVAVPSPDSAACHQLSVRARALGVADRFHLLPPVAPDQVATFLRSADVGLIPLRHFGSHEMALANKLFEYMHAGVPAVVSDCRAQAAFVRQNGTGEVHVAGDAASLAAAVRRVLDDPKPYRSRLADEGLLAANDWTHEAGVLQDVYRELLPALRDVRPRQLTVAEPPEVAPASSQEHGDRVTDGVVFGIGPANSAGQAWAWTRAAARLLPNVRPSVVTVRNEKYDFPTDVPVLRTAFAGDTTWQAAAATSAAGTWTHALLEAGRPIFGTLNGRDFRGDAAQLSEAGVEVGLVLHGSEVRDPRVHARTHPWSPFADPTEPRTLRLQGVCDTLLPLIRSFNGPVFASTPDQLEYVPAATWLPVIVDTSRWRPGSPVLERRVPLVVHAPSTPWLKGTEQVLAALQPLADEHRIRLLLVTGMPPAQAAALIRSADIVVDQVLLGLYGVLACEAMSAGRVVLGNVGESLRSRVPVDIPIVEVTPANLAEVVEGFLRDPAAGREVSARGPSFVENFHDGRYSSEVLAGFLSLPRDLSRPAIGKTPQQ